MTDSIDAQTGEILPGTEDNVIVCFALYQQEASKQKWWRSHRFLTDPIRKAVAKLAKRYKVSNSIMAIRIGQLIERRRG